MGNDSFFLQCYFSFPIWRCRPIKPGFLLKPIMGVNYFRFERSINIDFTTFNTVTLSWDFMPQFQKIRAS